MAATRIAYEAKSSILMRAVRDAIEELNRTKQQGHSTDMLFTFKCLSVVIRGGDTEMLVHDKWYAEKDAKERVFAIPETCNS
jgi:hypothetical protein